MAIASSLGFPRSWLDRLRQPVFIATALSLGAHGAVFAVAPLLSASDEPNIKEPEPVPVVTLSPEESLRLPGEILNGPSEFWGENPLITQDGDSLLPVPGLPPYGDLAGLGDGTTAPLWGSPIDVFSLPGSGESFDGSADYDFGDSGFGMTFGGDDGGAIDFGNSGFGMDLSAPTLPNQGERDGAGNNTPQDFSPNDDVAEVDRDLLGAEAAPGASPTEPLPQGQTIARAGGTTVDNVFENGSAGDPSRASTAEPGRDPNAPDANASEQGDGSTASTSNGLTPAQRLALENQQRREALRLGYTNNDAEAVDAPTLLQQAGELAAQNNLALQSQPQVLSVQFPDSKCPAQVRPAQLSTTVFANGNEPQVALVQSSQYPALDEAAEAAALARARQLTTPGVYLVSVSFHDDAGRCYSPSRGSEVDS